MGPDRSRSRSSTSGTRRPPSRDSTTSMHSAQTQLQHTDIAPAPQQQEQQIHQQPVQQVYNGVSADNMAAMLQAAAPDFGMQQAMKAYEMPGAHQHVSNQHSVPHGYYSTSQPYSQGQPVPTHPSLTYSNQFQPVRSASLPPQEAAFKMEDQARKAPSATATNDRELRELLNRNRNRALPDVAAEVIATERTSKSERTKQLFAMLWLEANTRPAKTSVPRSRVYHTYASRCADERVQPLNPASFGKLVRVIWPGIATRRLGVRGESKYHYVDLCLVNDPQENPQATRQRNMSVTSKTTEAPAIDFNSMPRLAADTAVLPTDDQSIGSPVMTTAHNLQPAAESRVFTDPNTPGLHSDLYPTASSYEQHLSFTNLDPTPPNKNDPIDLPDIFDYAPAKTDVDAAGALVALYKTHITSLIDCVRYCKEKQFFRLFTTIQGTMTVPVHKLFVHADIAPWIRECDWLMYQKMIQCVANLTLQVVPPVVIKFLDTVQRTLHLHISTTFHGVPHYLLEAKLEPATLFANLLHRLTRVNQAAHAAANVLNSQQVRDIMWREYVTAVNPKRVLENELPGCGYEAAYQILTVDLRQLLEPLTPDPFIDTGTHFESLADTAMTDLLTNTAADSSVDRIASFLTTLSARFPNVPARRIVDTVSLVGNAIIRDIVVSQGMSYSSWLIAQIFVSEMAMWLACLGGFLEHRPGVGKGVKSEQSTPALSASSLINGNFGGSRLLSRAASLGDTSEEHGGVGLGNESGGLAMRADGDGPLMTSQQHPSTLGTMAQAASHLHFATLHPEPAFEPPGQPATQETFAKPASGGAEEMDVHDDSGIGMGLIDEDGKMDGVRLDRFDTGPGVPNRSVQQQAGGFTALNMP